jgi:hypothetical protein
METRLVLLLAGCVLAGCGGLILEPAAASEDGSADGSQTDASQEVVTAGWAEVDGGLAFDGAAPCSPNGVRLCGLQCGDAAGCPVCSRLATEDGGASSLGVCWADLPDKGETPCPLCDDGQGCVQRGPGTFVCIPLEICGALLGLGAADVCWYGDKVLFDGFALPPAVGCPSDPAGITCGGDCPSCGGCLSRCVGRGPAHPFGLHPVPAYASSPKDVQVIPTCALSADGFSSAPCPPVSNDYTYACAISPYPPGDPSVARLNGLCLEEGLCKQMSLTLPGGLWCFDASGKRIPP